MRDSEWSYPESSPCSLNAAYVLEFFLQTLVKRRLLEQRTMKTDDNIIIERETYWKNVLRTREPHGYNLN